LMPCSPTACDERYAPSRCARRLHVPDAHDADRAVRRGAEVEVHGSGAGLHGVVTASLAHKQTTFQNVQRWRIHAPVDAQGPRSDLTMGQCAVRISLLSP
jgi:hypothetical protein